MRARVLPAVRHHAVQALITEIGLNTKNWFRSHTKKRGCGIKFSSAFYFEYLTYFHTLSLLDILRKSIEYRMVDF